MDEIAFDVKRGAVEICRINYPAERLSREIGYEGHSDDPDRSNNIAGPRSTTVRHRDTQALAGSLGHKRLESLVKWRSTFFCQKIVCQSTITRIAIDLIKKSVVAKTTCELFKGVDRLQRNRRLAGEKTTCAPRKPF